MNNSIKKQIDDSEMQLITKRKLDLYEEKLQQLEKIVDVYEKALQFYQEEDSYKLYYRPRQKMEMPIVMDAGMKATMALAEAKKIRGE